ncbi:MAG: hypothetical protein ACLQVA_19245 [Candidatus Brocadiia bacterium]
MSLTSECGYALIRAFAVAVAALIVGHSVRDLIAGASRRGRAVAWFLLLTPYLTPAPVVGYAYGSFALSLLHHPAWNQLFYAALLGLKLAPLAALVLYFAPSALTSEAIHCHRLLTTRSRASRIRDFLFRVRGSARPTGAAFALVFLSAFAEFEIASLLGIKTWTVVLFDAHAGGLQLTQSLRLVFLPAVVEGAILLAGMAVLVGIRPPAHRLSRERTGDLPQSGRAAWGFLAVDFGVVTVAPLTIVLRGTVQGIGVLFQDFVLGKDIAASLLFAVAGAACAYLVASTWSYGRKRMGWAFAACFPGLLGPLVLGLLVLAAFQLPGLRAAYDTPLPLLLALTLLFLPFALLLRMLLTIYRPVEALHAARLLGESTSSSVRGHGEAIARFIQSRGRFWVLFLLFSWGYFDLTASSILAPTRLTPVFVRLYNLMHYGQMSVLSAMVCAALCVPLILLGAAAGLRALLLRAEFNG